jgi:hypothetical protein
MNMTKQIDLTQGKFAIVDDGDFEMLSSRKWFAFNNCNRGWYAVCHNNDLPSRSLIRMHRVILNPPIGFFIDHINGNGLDNRRENLRVVNRSENQWNRKTNKNSVSGIKGIKRRKNDGKWRAVIRVHGKSIHIGYFDSLENAVDAYNESAKLYHGEFATLNPKN